MRVDAAKPDPSNVRAYDDWKLRVEQCRRAIRAQSKDVLGRSRLAAMTTTRAMFTFEEVPSLRPYDLVVFDEPSQVSTAHALVVAPLGRRVLFAGDPMQLAPVVQSEHPDAVKWLGESMFRHIDKLVVLVGTRRRWCWR